MKKTVVAVSAALLMGGCSLFTAPSTQVKPASSDISSVSKTRIRVVPPTIQKECTR